MLAERIRDFTDGDRNIEEKKMFGGLAFLNNGNMAVAASGQGGLLVRVDPDESDALAKDVKTKAQLGRWVTRGLDYARSLPKKR